MWVMSKIGFFSFVCEHVNPHNPGSGAVKDTIIVRARLRSHLVALKGLLATSDFAAAVVASEAAIVEGGGTDYPFRIKIPQNTVATVVGILAEHIDYDNFKGAVKEHAYHDALMGVWSCMRRLEAAVPLPSKPARHRANRQH